ncbi:MAG: translocation/assembly module TamB domain-containing protein, partial [Planctomycetota bacterium]
SALWRKLVIDPKALTFSLSSLALASEVFSVEAKNVTADLKDPRFSGKSNMTADLAGCVSAARALQVTPDNWPEAKPWPLLPNVTLPDLAGTLTAKASFAADENGETISDGAARVDALAVNGKRLFAKPGEVAWEGLALDAKAKAFALEKLSVASEIFTVNADKLRVATGEELQLAGVGNLKADLAGCLALGRSFLPEEDLPNLSGTLTAEASASPGKGGTIVSNGKARLDGLRIDDTLLLDGPANVQWQAAAFDPKEKVFGVASASVDSSVLTAGAKKLSVNPADLQIAGEGDVQADLAGCLAIVRALKEDADLPDITGRLTWAGKARTKGDLVDITGQGRATDVLLRRKVEEEEEAKELSLPLTTLDHDLRLDRKADRLSLRKFALDSKLLSAELTGTVAELRTRQVLDLRGKYDCAWDQVNLLIEQFAPDAGEMFAVTGRTGGPFVVTGPANEPDLKPVFRLLESTGSVGWQTAEVLGIGFEAATIKPALKDGRLTIPNTTVAAKEGKALIAGVVDFEPKSPTYRLAGRNLLLDRLKIDKKVLHQFLARFNPVFSDMASAEGFVSLETVDLELPLSDEIKTGGAGSGHLDLTEMTIRPGGLLLELLRLGGGVDPKQDTRMTVNRVDFVIKEGQIHYDNFTVTFPSMADFDLMFYGAAGFDGNVDLVCSVPVRAALLEKMKVTGPILDYARLLEGTRVGIPLAGEGEDLKLDFSKVNIQPLIQKALEALLKEQLEEQLGDEIRDRLKDLFK